jgi:hypothetical protein
MHDRELHEPAGCSTRATSLSVCSGVRDIHQAHERGHGIEGRGAKRQGGAVADRIADPGAVPPGGRGDEGLSDIQGGHPGTATGQQAGVMPLTAAQVQAHQPASPPARQPTGAARKRWSIHPKSR